MTGAAHINGLHVCDPVSLSVKELGTLPLYHVTDILLYQDVHKTRNAGRAPNVIRLNPVC